MLAERVLGAPDVVEAADAAGVSVRSLQRELAAEVLSFSALLDNAHEWRTLPADS